MYPIPKYKIQKIADKFEKSGFQIKILFLPVSHPELNPIEMVWSLVKRKVASKNLTFRLGDVEKETHEQLSKVSAETFAKYVEHTIEVETKYKELSVIDTGGSD